MKSHTTQTIATEDQITSWVEECRSNFRKILSNQKLLDQAITNNPSAQEMNLFSTVCPQLTEIPTEDKNQYEAVIRESSAQLNANPDHDYFKFYIIKASMLNSSDAEDDQEHARQLMREANDFETKYLYPMFNEEIKLHLSLADEAQKEIYQQLSAIIIPPQNTAVVTATQIIDNCLRDPSELVKAFNSRGSIDDKQKGAIHRFTTNKLYQALHAIDANDEQSIYKIHDTTRLGTLLDSVGIDKSHMTKSEILTYEAIIMHTTAEVETEYNLEINKCLGVPAVPGGAYPLVQEKVEEQLCALQKGKDSLRQLIYPVLKIAIENDMASKEHFKLALTNLKSTENPSAITIRDEVSQLFKEKDPLFSVAELTNILETVHHKLKNPLDNDNSLNDAAEKISHHAKADQKFQKLKAGLIIFSASCLLVAAAAATVFSFGILAPITLPTMVAATAAITAAVPLAGYHAHRFNEIKDKYRLSLKELANADKQATVVERHKHASFDSDEGHTTDEDNSENNSRPSSPK